MSTQQGADMTDTKNDPHAELMRLADEHASIKFVEGIDGNEALVDKAYEALEVYAVALTGRLTQAEQEITAYDLTMDRQTARIAELEKSYSDACKLVADMHLAAVGEVKGPKRGVVEDVADLRAERDDLRAQLETVGAGGVSMMTRTLTDRLEQAEQEIIALTLSITNRDARIAELEAVGAGGVGVMREKFEEVCATRLKWKAFVIAEFRGREGDYRDDRDLNLMWSAWQAALSLAAQPAPAETFAINWAKAIEDAAIEYADVYVELQCDADNDHQREHRTALSDLRETIKRGLENAAIAANKKEPS